MRYTYTICVNKGCRARNGYSFRYGNTKDIYLSFKRSGAVITAVLTHNYMEQFEDSYLRNLLKEAVKRVALLYLLTYQKQLQIHRLTLKMTDGNDNVEELELTDRLILYPFSDGELVRPLNDAWADSSILKQVLCFQKSKTYMAREMSSLFAYLCSKMRQKETERFIYLWIAMNGLFVISNPDDNSERNQMRQFLFNLHQGTEIFCKENRNREGRAMLAQVSHLPEPVTKESLESDDTSDFSAYVGSLPEKYTKNCFEGTSYGFLLTDVPYYVRCNLFHANRPLELFSFRDDMELTVLRIVNGLLEDYLDNNLHRYFEPNRSRIHAS